MTRGEGGFAGAVGAGVPDEEMVENKVSGGHEDDRDGSPAEFGVDFGERFGFDPLTKGEHGKKGEHGNGGY